jgi:nitrogenase molybdenum-iron protein alpha/beta subunit
VLDFDGVDLVIGLAKKAEGKRLGVVTKYIVHLRHDSILQFPGFLNSAYDIFWPVLRSAGEPSSYRRH